MMPLDYRTAEDAKLLRRALDRLGRELEGDPVKSRAFLVRIGVLKKPGKRRPRRAR